MFDAFGSFAGLATARSRAAAAGLLAFGCYSRRWARRGASRGRTWLEIGRRTIVDLLLLYH
jgi:hypothetical protein